MTTLLSNRRQRTVVMLMFSAVYLLVMNSDGKEQEADMSTVCIIQVISQHLNAMDPGLLAKESSKDPVTSTAGGLFYYEEWMSSF